jgi:hypothetical protein
MNDAGGSNASMFAIYAALAYDVIAATNSSPQTTEINAKARSQTLMKWVYIGVAQTFIFVALGAAMQRAQGRPVWPPILGGLLGSGLMHGQYVYAMRCGLQSMEPGTESYGAQSWQTPNAVSAPQSGYRTNGYGQIIG